MRIITVRQPWAWAIIHGGKDVENRSRNIAGSYRGPVAIHVSKAIVPNGDPAWSTASSAGMDTDIYDGDSLHLGHIIGVVDLIGVHEWIDESACHGHEGLSGATCSTWSMDTHWHLELANPRPIDPIPAKGRLGLWKPDADLEAAINDALRPPARDEETA